MIDRDEIVLLLIAGLRFEQKDFEWAKQSGPVLTNKQNRLIAKTFYDLADAILEERAVRERE